MTASRTVRGLAASRSFPPEIALHITKLACELPSQREAPLALWDCTELARALVAAEIVEAISAETVRRVLALNQLKPWREHGWLSATVPRDAAFAATVREICDLYTRPQVAHEAILCVDEKTNLQPRPRTAPTLPARAEKPVRVEHAYARRGALHLFAAFNTHTGDVIGWSAPRKRAEEFIAFLDLLDASLPAHLTAIHLVLDNLSVHKSRAVTAWLADHPRFHCHFPPVHCSWMNQVEQWFGILERKALRFVDFASTLALDRHLHGFIAHWNRYAHPFNKLVWYHQPPARCRTTPWRPGTSVSSYPDPISATPPRST